MTETPLLAVEELEKHFPIKEGLLRREVGRVRAVDSVSFDVWPGETFGLVGESGCGKSTTALSILRLEEPTGGDVRFDGESVLEYNSEELRAFRRQCQLVLQDPDSAFNPRQPVGEAVAEPLRLHGISDEEKRRHVVTDTLKRVSLGDADIDSFPHEFSGGEKQRLAIARALVLNPDLIIADEPVSALDGRTKTEVLDLLSDLQREFDLSILMISHDIDMIRRFCDRIAVMYLGTIVERGEIDEVVSDPCHPYTRTLFSSVPTLDPNATTDTLDPLSDELPDASEIPSGCRFHPRCPAIIQPEALTLPREEWLSLVAFRQALADDWGDAGSFRASIQGGTGDDRATLSERIRRKFDLPEEFADATAERAVSATIDRIQADDLAGARRELADTVTTICETEPPELTDEYASRPVSCHRYDPRRPGQAETDLQFTSPGR